MTRAAQIGGVLLLLLSMLAISLLTFGCGKGDQVEAQRLAASGRVEDWEKAARLYEDQIQSTLKAYNQAGYFHGKIGYELMKRNQNIRAIEHLNKALQYYPQDDRLHLYLATCYANLSRTDERQRDSAKLEYERALVLNPKSSEAEYGLATLLYYQYKDTDGAKEHLNRAVSFDEKSPDPQILWGRIAADEKDYTTARTHYLQAYNLLPPTGRRTAEVAYSLGVLAGQLGDQRESVRFLEKAAELNKGMEGVQKKLDEARSALEGPQ